MHQKDRDCLLTLHVHDTRTCFALSVQRGEIASIFKETYNYSEEEYEMVNVLMNFTSKIFSMFKSAQ